MIDVDGSGIELTDAANGVRFDIGDDGLRDQVAWTKRGSTNAWLVLDRNNNGVIDNGGELFGNVTKQPLPQNGHKKNGFLALAEFDKPENGGNADGVIDAADRVYSMLRLWQDANHNGISGHSELHSLSSLNVDEISLDYKDSHRMDGYGNRFRYRSKVSHGDRTGGRWAWDVILLVDNSFMSGLGITPAPRNASQH